MTKMPNPDSDIQPRTRFPGLVLTVVFVSGYIIMALEILAFRIIQAGIDSSILATGAILGIVLSALTLGYWAGGTWSTKFNPALIQAAALLIAGFWIFSLAGLPNPLTDLFKATSHAVSSATPFLAPPWRTVPDYIISNPVSENMDIRLRVDPLLASLILFALPSFLLAMIGPCAVQLITRRASEAGRTAGWVFALGSLGSIAGVIITSFWLIAFLGISANLRLIGLIAVIMGLWMLLTHLFRKKLP